MIVNEVCPLYRLAGNSTVNSTPTSQDQLIPDLGRAMNSTIPYFKKA